MENAKIRRLFAVRHGDCSDDKLTRNGKTQINNLALGIRYLVPKEESVTILSSPEGRAMESANIIGKVFRVTPKIVGILKEEKFCFGDSILKATLPMIITSHSAILITHHESPSGIIHAFLNMYFLRNFGVRNCSKGNGFMLNLLNGDVQDDLHIHAYQ